MVQAKLLLKFKKLEHYFFDRDESWQLAKWGIKSIDWVGMKQIHGNKVELVTHGGFISPDCDALVTKKPLFLKIETADCLPIFFYETKKRIIAAVHAGWRGLFLGIIGKTLKEIKNLGGSPASIVAAVGPHIKVCCYQVSKERVELFKDKLKESSPIAVYKNSHWFLDLERITIWEMEKSGLLRHNIETIRQCTFCCKNYYSFRREGETTGRMISIIGLQ